MTHLTNTPYDAPVYFGGEHVLAGTVTGRSRPSRWLYRANQIFAVLRRASGAKTVEVFRDDLKQGWVRVRECDRRDQVIEANLHRVQEAERLQPGLERLVRLARETGVTIIELLVNSEFLSPSLEADACLARWLLNELEDEVKSPHTPWTPAAIEEAEETVTSLMSGAMNISRAALAARKRQEIDELIEMAYRRARDARQLLAADGLPDVMMEEEARMVMLHIGNLEHEIIQVRRRHGHDV